MGNEIPSGANSNYFESLKNAGLSPNQLSRLDALNGVKNDRVIDKDVFTIANSIIQEVELKASDIGNAGLVQEVSDIMHGDIDVSQIGKEYEATPLTGITPETLMQGLHLSQDQIDALLELSYEMTGHENTIDRGIASAVICNVRKQPAPRGIPEDLNARIANILGGQEEQNNNQFGL